jgi:glycosyltransferase involved in cell wall biosynthesis
MTEASGAEKGGGLRVLRIFSRLNIGGPSLHVILLSAGLRPLGYETRLVVGRESPREGNMLALAAEKSVTCEAMAGLGREIAPLQDLRALVGLHRLMRAWRPAIVHTHTAKAGVLGRLAARSAGVPTVVHTYHGHVLRGYFSPAQTALFRWLETRLAAAADALVAVSDAVKEDLVGLGIAPAERIRVIPLGLELEHLAAALPRGVLRGEAGIPEGVPLVGMVGRLVPIKDVPTFLRAARIVRETRPEARFALVGDGEERPALESLCRELDLDGKVTFFGWRRDLAAVYGDLDVVVNASRNEGTPVALIEALAAAKPVVATRVGGTPDLLGEGERGRLVPPAEPLALARAVLETLEESEAARRRAQAGREHVLARHSSDRLVRDVDALYRELRATKKAA